MPFDLGALEALLNKRAAGDDVPLALLVVTVRAFLGMSRSDDLLPSVVVDRLVVVANALDHLPNRLLLLGIAKDIVLLNVPVDEVQLAYLLKSLANAHALVGDDQQAQTLLWQALRIQERYVLPSDLKIANTLVALANTYKFVSKESLLARESFLRRALIIQKANYAGVHQEIVFTLMNLAATYGAWGDYKRQLKVLELALAGQRAIQQPNYHNTGLILLELSSAYEALLNVEEAYRHAKEAHDLLFKHCGVELKSTQVADEKVQRLGSLHDGESARAAHALLGQQSARSATKKSPRQHHHRA